MTGPLHSPQILTVKSSAGTGKTYTLALRYLQLLINEAMKKSSPKNSIVSIVAITFTNKAAAEMRSRIIEWMKRVILDIPFANSTQKPIDAIMGIHVDIITRTEVIEAVKKNFEAILKNFYDFKVGTIDSFVNLILKASAFKLNLPPDFDISTESSFYIDLVLQEAFQRILEEKGIRKKFDRFIYNYIEIEGESVSWIPKMFLKEVIYNFWQEETKENKRFTQSRAGRSIQHIRESIVQDAQSLLHYLTTTKGIEANKRFINALENLLSLQGFDFKGSSYFKKDNLQMLLNKKSGQADGAYEILWQRIRTSLARFVNIVAASRFSSYIEIYNLFKKMLKDEITFCKRLILIEELNALLQTIVDRKEFVPEIYYALSEQYSHFLIDEFQDTNRLQWKNMEILVEEALSRGGTLFLVGDKKQAIYRWRGGHPELIDDITTRYASYPISVIKLDTNYRSGEHIVRFNNTVFYEGNLTDLVRRAIKEATPEEVKDVTGVFSEAEQKHRDLRAGEGYVYVENITPVEEEDERKENLLKDEQYEVTKKRFVNLIQEIRKRNVFDDREIAVLVRRREEADFIVKALLEIGAGVESEFTVNIKNHPSVQEAISFLQFINDPDDDLSFAAFITGKIFTRHTGLSMQEINEWITNSRIDSPYLRLYKLFEAAYPDLWKKYFEFFFKTAGYLPLYEYIVLFLKQWNVFQHFPEDGPYFLHLCELIATRETSGENNLSSFLYFWNETKQTPFEATEREKPFLLKTTEGANAIKVLTIHKAKGLEFPVVILPFLKFTPFGTADIRDRTKFFVHEREGLKLFYIKKDFCDYSERLDTLYRERERQYVIDELNILYVACTRPEKELYLLLGDSKRQKNLLADYLFNLDTLKGFIQNNTIVIGQKTKERDRSIVAGEDNVCDFPVTDIGKEIIWMEKIKTKLQNPEASSYSHIMARKEGDLIHYILSSIIQLPLDYESVIKQRTREAVRRHGLYAFEIPVQSKLLRFFETQECRKFFQPEENAIIYTEKEIIDTYGNLFKVDRIIIHHDHIDVIDFKTGEKYEDSHVEQIVRYGNLVERIHQGKAVRRYLVYIEPDSIEEV